MKTSRRILGSYIFFIFIASIIIMFPRSGAWAQEESLPLLYQILKKENLLEEYRRVADAIGERTGHVISPEVGGEENNPFRLEVVNYVLRHPFDLPAVAAEMAGSLSAQIRGGKPFLAGMIGEGMTSLDLKPAPADGRAGPFASMAEFIIEVAQTLHEAEKIREEVLSVLSAKEIQSLYGAPEFFFPSLPGAERKEKSTAEKQKENATLLFFLQSALKVDLEKLANASAQVAQVLDIGLTPASVDFSDLRLPADWAIEERTGLIRLETPYGVVFLGGSGDNVYREDALLIIDIGGDDIYLNNAGASAKDYPFAVVIDYSGDDIYRSSEYFAQGSGFLGGGFLIDYAGDDRYLAKGYAQGSGFLGTGLLADLGGDDQYVCQAYCQGAGIFGIGVLAEADGHDSYYAGIYAQGFGSAKGYGALAEAEGDDHYYAGGVYPDHRQPDKAYVAMSQGFGFGLRPSGNKAGASGGVGIIADAKGDDTYIGDYFGQGASYWYALGILSDKSGDDKYIAARYSQGAGVHHSAGILADAAGDDEYLVHYGVSQGCGHDLAIGFLLDNGGDDRYVGGIISQGAGHANGIGVFNDNGGDDAYQFQEPGQGSGQYLELRRLGSFGVFIDTGGGDDYYSDRDKNGDIIYKNELGIFADTQ